MCRPVRHFEVSSVRFAGRNETVRWRKRSLAHYLPVRCCFLLCIIRSEWPESEASENVLFVLIMCFAKCLEAEVWDTCSPSGRSPLEVLVALNLHGMVSSTKYSIAMKSIPVRDTDMLDTTIRNLEEELLRLRQIVQDPREVEALQLMATQRSPVQSGGDQRGSLDVLHHNRSATATVCEIEVNGEHVLTFPDQAPHGTKVESQRSAFCSVVVVGFPK